MRRTVTVDEKAARNKRSQAASKIQKFARTKVINNNRASAPSEVVNSGALRKKYGQVGPEVKFADTAVFALAQANTTANIGAINSVAQGTTISQRIGNKIQIKSVEVKFVIGVNSGFQHPYNAHRVSLILDKDPQQAAVASYNQIYTANTVTSYRNLSYSDRFVVLAVEEFTTPSSDITVSRAVVTGGDATKIITLFRNVDIATKFVGTGATQSDMGTNQLLVAWVSFATDTQVEATCTARIRYTDE